METVKQETIELIKPTERERLELTEKKVEIQKKRLENKKAKLDMDELLANRNLEANRLLNDKISSILFSLMVNTIDADRTILGSEPFYTPLLGGKHRDVALNKLMELIKRI